MSKINYAQLIKSAWETTWNNKRLWWFGFFIALSGGIVNTLNYTSNFDRSQTEDKVYWQEMVDFFSQNLHWIIAIGIILVILYLIVLFLGFVAKAGLFKAIRAIEKGTPLDFKAGMREGKKYLSRLVAISLLVSISAILFFIILLTPVIFLFIKKIFVAGIILAIFAALICIPVIILLSFLKVYGHFYVVLGDLRVRDALTNAYQLLENHFADSVIMGLIAWGIGIMVSVGFLVPIIPIIVVFGLIAGIAYFLLGSVGAIAVAILGLIAIMILATFFQSIYQTFSVALWLFFFREIASPKKEEPVSEEIPVPKTLPAIDPLKPFEK